MTEAVKGVEPALNPEEWKRVQGGKMMTWEALVLFSHHGNAAALLYDQPWGFTRGHLLSLRMAVEQLRNAKDASGCPVAWPTTTSALDEVADRIEALLPPEG